MNPIHGWMAWLLADYDETPPDWRPRRLHWLVLIIGAIAGYIAVLVFVR